MILYAGDWPRLPPSDFRVRTLDGVADDWPLSYEELEPYYDRIAREVGVVGAGRRPSLSRGRRPAPPALPLGDGVIDVVRAHDRLVALVAGAERDLGALPAGIRARSGGPACRAAPRARRRPPT